MVGNGLYSRLHATVPKSVEGVGTCIVAKPVDTGEPYLLAILVHNFVAVCKEPVIALNGILRTLQKSSGVCGATLIVLIILVVLVVSVYSAFFYNALTAV